MSAFCIATYTGQYFKFDAGEAARRLRAICLSKEERVKTYLAHSDDKHDSQLAEFYSRLFVEYVYDKRLASISRHDWHKLVLQIHPDKNHFAEANALFQLHQRLTETADLFGSTSCVTPFTWFNYSLYSWFYMRHLRSDLRIGSSLV
jgi:hypothetical protein